MTQQQADIASHFTSFEVTALLRFYQWAGLDIAVQDMPFDHFTKKQTPRRQPDTAPQRSPSASPQRETTPATVSAAPMTVAASIEQARNLARQATTLEALRESLACFEGCALKLTAKHTCFADGTPGSPLMLVGEAPGRDEDIQGLPFVGRSGQLLNHILTAIGLERPQVYIANVIPWRPPGNRTPTHMEIELCRPFLLRQIELAKPKLLVALGGPATNFLTGKGQGILKLRGQWLSHTRADGVDIPVMPTLHPAYLLRSPAHKKFAWQDFLRIKQRLQDLSAPA